jgi:Tfp pilus assembly protein PilN
MVQFNLLPDVKLQFIKARRTKRLVILFSTVASAAALAVFLILVVYVDVVQKKSISDLNNDVTKYSNDLKAIPDLDKILTVQNQLKTLTGSPGQPGLHDQKPVISRLFKYLSQLTPQKVTLSNLSMDFTQHTATLTGAAPTLDVVNGFVDTLKSTTYVTEVNSTKTKAFTSVVLSSFSRNSSGASYTITLTFDQAVFDTTHTVTLTVPQSSVSNNSVLFKEGE